jgi:hypothetical protein
VRTHAFQLDGDTHNGSRLPTVSWITAARDRKDVPTDEELLAQLDETRKLAARVEANFRELRRRMLLSKNLHKKRDDDSQPAD